MATRRVPGSGPRRTGSSGGARPAPESPASARAGVRSARARAEIAQLQLLKGVQQVWLAGMGAIARAQKDGPMAFQDAVLEGFRLLNRSRSAAQDMVRDAFESAQETLQSRVIGSAREQAQGTMENIEALFQNRVQRTLQQLGVPTAEEIRELSQRVAELSDEVRRQRATRAGQQKRVASPAPTKRRVPKRRAGASRRGKSTSRQGS
jgi:poly(hydroxyalkanoate) granule-associated protein